MRSLPNRKRKSLRNSLYGRPWERRHPCLLGVAQEEAGRDACAPRAVHTCCSTHLKLPVIIARAESLKEQRSVRRRPCDPPLHFVNAPGRAVLPTT